MCLIYLKKCINHKQKNVLKTFEITYCIFIFITYFKSNDLFNAIILEQVDHYRNHNFKE